MIEDFKNYLKLHVNSEETLAKYLNVVEQFLKIHSEFNQNTVNAFLTAIVDRKNSASTFNVYMTGLKQYAKFLNISIDFPKQKKVAKKIKASVNQHEIEKEILPYFDCMFTDPDKRKLVFRFTMLSMLRVSEVCKLKKEDIDFETNRINIINGKGNKNRVTFLHKSIAEDVKKFMLTHDDETVFNICDFYLTYMFQEINNQLNYKKNLTPHSLRHAGALHFYDTTHDLKALKEILGHENINTTENYIRGYDLDSIQQQFNKMKYKKGA
jgi:integrase/recombinase XerD